MRERDPIGSMWAEACELLGQAERLQRQFFRLDRPRGARAAWEPPVDVFEENENLVVKTDVQGSLEPVLDQIQRLGTAELGVRVLHSATGDVTESDVNLAAASDAVILAYRVGSDSGARRASTQHGVEIREYQVIYKLVEDLSDRHKVNRLVGVVELHDRAEDDLVRVVVEVLGLDDLQYAMDDAVVPDH